MRQSPCLLRSTPIAADHDRFGATERKPPVSRIATAAPIFEWPARGRFASGNPPCRRTSLSGGPVPLSEVGATHIGLGFLCAIRVGHADCAMLNPVSKSAPHAERCFGFDNNASHDPLARSLSRTRLRRRAYHSQQVAHPAGRPALCLNPCHLSPFAGASGSSGSHRPAY